MPVEYKSLDRRRALLLSAAALTTTMCSRRQPGPALRSPTTQMPVNIVNTAGTFAATVQQLMKDRRYLEDLGLRPNFISVADGSKVIGALVSGDADICTASGFSPVLPAIERGGHLKVIAGSEVLLLHLVYSCRPEIRRVKDLEGRTVGTGPVGALLHSIMVALLRKHGVDPRKVKFVNVGSSADVFRSVVAKVVDAGPSELDYQGEEGRYAVHGLVDGNFWDNLQEYTNQASYASERALAERRDVLVRTLAAYARLYRFISSPVSKDAYLAARATALNKDEPTEALAQWNFFQQHQSFALDLMLSEQRIRYMQELNVSLGVQKAVMPFERIADMSLARDAITLLNKT
jgi:ABC-type nitrate/sulfonate/bicarbonate transport system substrate-binding protein